MITTITITVEGKDIPKRMKKLNTLQLSGDKLKPNELKGLVNVIESYIQAKDGEEVIRDGN